MNRMDPVQWRIVRTPELAWSNGFASALLLGGKVPRATGAGKRSEV
jgi:hypothetical protein